ncbi:IclR family transcriptional regulator [Sutterella sp.]|uniref:IclR family transcriptional regulator n=1 Tax=Sutterella sp. TaxID=1981025 RepID=UPI0026E07CE1|nr:IclR family transcriptional regulator [Sutterella sp.]MDO5531681.1 IclR family transcriptional regulator [Sutterella sp.]
MTIQSVDRAVSILRLLSDHKAGLPVSGICTRLGLPLGTAHRFLQTLVGNGLVMQDRRTKFYRLGLGMLRLASVMINSDSLSRAAKAPMQKCADEIGNLVYLCRENAGDVVCVACVSHDSGSNLTQFAAQIGGAMPFHAAAAGKIILAYGGLGKFDQVFTAKAPLEKFTDRTRVAYEDVLDDLRTARARGWAVCDEELEPGVIAVAAPVRNFDGTVSASVAATGVKAGVSLPGLIQAVTDCAAAISRAQGYAPV